MPNSSSASVVSVGAGKISRASSSFASWTSASPGSFVPKTTRAETHHPPTEAFTPARERSSLVCPSHPEYGPYSICNGGARSGKSLRAGSAFLDSIGIPTMMTIPSGGSESMVAVASPPG